MEDEEGYMALHVQSKKEESKYNSKTQVQEMKLYNSHWPRLIVGTGCVMIFLLSGVIIGLGVWGFKMKQHLDTLEKGFIFPGPTEETKNHQCWEYMSHVHNFLCKSLDNITTERSICRLCPSNWSLYKHKCYWISKDKQTWHKSREDCRAKQSQMLVIQSLEEVAFIQSLYEGAQLMWIGLEATFSEQKWTWVDGLPFESKLFQELGPVKENLCGRLNGDQVIPETCSIISTWMCEREAFLLSLA